MLHRLVSSIGQGIDGQEAARAAGRPEVVPTVWREGARGSIVAAAAALRMVHEGGHPMLRMEREEADRGILGMAVVSARGDIGRRREV